MSLATAGPCDDGLAGAACASGRPSHTTGTLAARLLGSSLAFIDGSVVNVGLPAIERDVARDRRIDRLTRQRLPAAARRACPARRRRQRSLRPNAGFLAGMVLFSAASLACALAPGFGWLPAARAAEGIGAAFLMPASLALVGAAFNGEARGRAVGSWAGAGAITGALGPLAGGWLIDAVGWSSIFLRSGRRSSSPASPSFLASAPALCPTAPISCPPWRRSPAASRSASRR